ncbi:hypothetical protein [Salibacter halophilus]|uniref:Uncharacterized protein n=1 Tax=Salibacter halophilus TaxID=1803916 RepID=A0A6N6M9X2_9FLAO|nr:hypothetical protein [Salibacter halophilus]KAB1066032.1 hypothetical protein F3059_00765 [Salibacter halophilus]
MKYLLAVSKNLTDSNTGAIRAMRGFRLQTLFTVREILSNLDSGLVYEPEGLEDLDVSNLDNKLQQLVQVKSTNDMLYLADITKSLLRAAKVYESGESPQLKVVCFGKISKGLTDLFSPSTSENEFTARLAELEINSPELIPLKENTSFISVDEETYIDDVIRLIQERALALNPNTGIDLLHQWVARIAEKGGTISQESLLNQLNSIGKFVAEREDFHQHLHRTIRPVQDVEIDTLSMPELENGFHKGVGATYKHILAGLDVSRETKMDEVYEAFQHQHVAIIHGASGQGKSTLAYRFIRQHYRGITYEVMPLSWKETTEQIAALRAISSSLDFPLLIYIDVKPGNTNWVELLRDFVGSNAFKFLITIREEDWNKTPNKGVHFQFGDVALELHKTEAESIYERLTQRAVDKHHTGFAEAWIKFGEQGPLLEFTYLTTQGETLRERIQSQLDRIEKEQPRLIPLLKIVGFADAMGAGIQASKITASSIVTELRLAVKTLEREYLLRYSDEETTLTGLHPIRSGIISELLHLDKQELAATAEQCTSLVAEPDLYIFLVSVFRYHTSTRERIINILPTINCNTYTGCVNVLNALIWIDVKSLIEDHQALWDELYEQDSFLLHVRTHLDFTGMLNDMPLFPENENFQNARTTVIQKLEEHQISQERIFNRAQQWLVNAGIPASNLDTDQEASSFGELLFWTARLAPNKEIHLNREAIIAAVNQRSLGAASRALFGLHAISEEGKIIAFDAEPNLLQRIGPELNVAYLERSETSVTAHFLLDIFKDFDSGENIAHQRKLEIIDILRYALPYLDSHGAKGYGHKTNFIESDFDDSSAQIKQQNNPIYWLTSINSLILNLLVYEKRPETWEEFVAHTLKIRSAFSSYLQQMVSVLEEHFKKNRSRTPIVQFATEAITYNTYQIEYEILFPKPISDPTGRVSEDSSKDHKREDQNDTAETSLLTDRFRDFKDAHKNYFSSLNAFNWQSLRTIFDRVGISIEKQKQLHRMSLVNLIQAFDALNVYQAAFTKHFEKYSNPQTLRELENKEKQAITALAYGWKHFVCPMQQLPKKLAKEGPKTFEKIERDFLKRLNKTCQKKTDEALNSVDFSAHTEAHPRTVIIHADCINLLDTFTALELAINILFESVGSCPYLSFKRTVLDHQFDEYWIVVSQLGEVPAYQAYKFSMFDLEKGKLEEIPSYRWIPVPVPAEALKQANIRLFQRTEEIEFAQSLLDRYSTLTISTGVLSQLFELSGNANPESDTSVLESWLNTLIEDTVNTHSNLVEDLMTVFDKYKDSEDPDKLDFVQTIASVVPALSPTEEGETMGDTIAENINTMKNWQARLTECGAQVMLIYLYLLVEATSLEELE